MGETYADAASGAALLINFKPRNKIETRTDFQCLEIS